MAATSLMVTKRIERGFTVFAALALFASLALTIPVRPDWWQVVILGAVQGLTEFLPISSTAHLLIVADLLNYQGSIGGTFEIFIQFGTVISVFVFYVSELLAQANALLGRNVSEKDRDAARRFWLSVIVAFIPAAAIGVLARDFIKSVLYETPQVIASALIIGGIIFIVLERLPRKQVVTDDAEEVSWKQALGIGLAQCFALIPGVSRSGATIVGGLFAGLDRRSATTFSFYLAIPTLGAATMVDLLGSIDQIQRSDWGALLLGATVAMIVGWLSIGWLLRYVARNDFTAFGIYRIVAGLAILALAAFGSL